GEEEAGADGQRSKSTHGTPFRGDWEHGSPARPSKAARFGEEAALSARGTGRGQRAQPEGLSAASDESCFKERKPGFFRTSRKGCKATIGNGVLPRGKT